MKVLRTPDERFVGLPGYPFEPHYKNVPDTEGGELRIHYVDEGPSNAPAIVLMHGEPAWSYLYRKMIPVFTAAGYRAIAPDLVGFGRSDKPADRADYTYERHVAWMVDFLDQLNLEGATMFCQDWGGLIGLRMVAARPDTFARVVAANTGLPTGDHPISQAFMDWRKMSREMPVFDIEMIMGMALVAETTPEIKAAYAAPYPDESYKEGARIFPSLVPITPDDPSSQPNRDAWKVLSAFEKPFLTAFADQDEITHAGQQLFIKLVPGAQGQDHTTIENAGHFLQEDQGEKVAQVVLEFIRKTS